MPTLSTLELPGSPQEQASWATETWYWSPANELATGAVVSAPTCTVYQYDPAYAANAADRQDVTASVLAAGSPFIGGGSYANTVRMTMHSLAPGYEYEVRLGCTSSDGNKPGRFFRLRCIK